MRLTHLDSGYPIYWPDDPAGFLCDEAEFQSWVAVDRDGQVLGHVALHQAEGDQALRTIQETRPAKAYDYAVVARLLVDPEQQGHGIGNLLLDTAVNYSFDRGQHPILDVTKTTKPAIVFYEAHGWRRVGETSIELSDRPDIELWVYIAPSPSQGAGS